MSGPAGAGGEGGAELVLLFDVDYTLIDTDAVKAGLEAGVRAAIGPAGARRFGDIRERVRAELGVTDLHEAIGRYARERGERRRGPLEAALAGVDFAGCVLPGALEAIAHARGLGRPVILTDGEPRWQRAKVRAAGLEDAVGGRVLVCARKERELDAVRAAHPARRYALIDDKPRIHAAVKSALGASVVTILVEQGPYARERRAGGPPPDLRLPSIAAFAGLDAAALRAPAGERAG